MAYDPLLSEIVLFDGCSYWMCPDNETWTYNGISWTNLTGKLPLAPSAREGAGLDYDPGFSGVILFGGTNNVSTNLDDTWLFNGTSWSNITSRVGIPQQPDGGAVAWSWGAMAFDPALEEMLAVDGCADALCSSIWNYTWFLTAAGWGVSAGPGALTSSTALAYSSAAYDASNRDLVLFGGYDALSGTTSNDTFLLNPSGVWVNTSLDDAGCVGARCYAPSGRDSAVMTWDAQLGAILMTDGYNVTAGVWLNDSWAFSGGFWLPADLSAPRAPSGYCAAAQPALAESSNNVPPLIIGGFGRCSPDSSTSEWVYEVPPQPTSVPTPLRFDLGMSTTFNVSWTVGTGSGIVATWNVSLGNGSYSSHARGGVGENTSTAYSQKVSHTYGATGTFDTNVTWTDFFYITGTFSPSPLTVNPDLEATISASATSVQEGGRATFSTDPTGGTVPYTYAWSFGDGTTSNAQDPPAQVFPQSGLYTIDLTVTDNVSQSVKSSMRLTVVALPPLKIQPGSLDIYLIAAVLVVVLVALAVLRLIQRQKMPPKVSQASPPAAKPGLTVTAVPGPAVTSRPSTNGSPRRPPSQ